MPSFIWFPSSLAEPVKAAEIPSRISLSVTPRMVGARSPASRTTAARAVSSPMGRGSVDAVGGERRASSCASPTGIEAATDSAHPPRIGTQRRASQKRKYVTQVTYGLGGASYIRNNRRTRWEPRHDIGLHGHRVFRRPQHAHCAVDGLHSGLKARTRPRRNWRDSG